MILRVHGGAPKYYYRRIGINSRLDSLQAAILRVKLKHLEEWTEARRERAENYGELFTEAKLTDKINIPFVREGARHTFNYYVVRVQDGGRDALFRHLGECGVGADIYYPVPLHLQDCFRYLGYSEGDFRVAERAARETLALPMYPELSQEQQQYVVDSIKRFFE